VDITGDLEAALALAQALAYHTRLTSLNLQALENGMDSTWIQALAPTFTHNASLTYLNLEDNEIDHVAMKAIAQALSTNTCLTSLCLRDNNIGPNGAQDLVSVIANNVTLTELDLKGNDLTNTGIKALAPVLASSSIKTLNMKRNKIDGEGAQALIQALTTCTSLTNLNLSKNYIDTDAMQRILILIAHNTTLTHFDFPVSSQPVAPSYIKDCFRSNTTLIDGESREPLIEWFKMLNSVCKEMGVGPLCRDSVPQGEMEKEKVQLFLQELVKNSEPWKVMKVVVLGHGRIGKTTLLCALHDILYPGSSQRV